MKLPLLIVLTLIVVATLIANSGQADFLFDLVQLIPGKDLTGHFLLYGAFGWTLSLYLNGVTKRHWRLMLIVVTLIVAEECSQAFFRHRTFSIADLACSLLGFGVGTLIESGARHFRQNVSIASDADD